MRHLALLLVFCASAAVAEPRDDAAREREVPRFVVVPVDEAESARLESLYAALEAAGAHVVDRTARAGLDLPLAPALFDEALLDEPRAAMLAAKAALRELDLEAVDAHLDDALDASLRLPNPGEQRDLLTDILLLRAEMALARNKPDEARRDLRLVARLDERRLELHPGLFPPNVVDAYATARADNDAAESAYLTLLQDHDKATLVVLVDGREVAADVARSGPLDIKAGPHLVTLLAPGRVSRSVVVDLAPREPLSLSTQLFAPRADETRAAALATLRRASTEDDTRPSLVALLEGTGASTALLLVAGRAFTFTPARGRVLLAVKPDDDATRLASAALASLREPSVRAPPTTLPPEEAQESDLVTLAVGGAAVAVAVVAVTTGAIALAWALQPAEDVPPPPVPVVVTGFGGGR